MKRDEFTRSARVEIIMRAAKDRSPSDVPYFSTKCEKCGKPTLGKFEIHHVKMDAMKVERRKLTAADGMLLCVPCHAEETKAQAPILAEAKRREASHLGIRRRSKQPFPVVPSNLPGPERAHQDRPSLPPRSLYEQD